MPIPKEAGRAIQLKEGSFTFPPNFCRVDVSAHREFPRKFDICKQGIEALGDLFFEVQIEQKEGISVQKAIWENVLDRILKVGVFNASSTYTNLNNQMLPIRVSLPQDRQHFSVEASLSSEPTNPLRETKKFARELFDIVAAVKALREEPLFQCPDFYLYPSRESFVITEAENGERHLAAGIYSMAPGDVDETASSELLTVKAVQDIVQDRWDRGRFRKVLKASRLNDIFAALRHLSRDVPPLEKLAINTGYAVAYGIVAFVALWLLMFLSSVTVNSPDLDKITLKLISANGEETVLDPAQQPIRIVMDVESENADNLQVIGRYRAQARIEKMAAFMGFLDKWSRLNYEKEMKITDFAIVRDENRDKVKGKLFMLEDKDDYTFRLKALTLWGRQRFSIVPAAGKTGEGSPSLEIDAIVQQGTLDKSTDKIKNYWELTTVGDISFERADKEYIEQDLKIYAGPVKEGSAVAETEKLVADRSFFSMTFSSEIEQSIPRIAIQYLAGETETSEVGSLTFEKYQTEKKQKLQVGRNPLVETVYGIGTGKIDPKKRTGKTESKKPVKAAPRRADDEETEEGTDADIFIADGIEYYHLPDIPPEMAITNIRVKVRTQDLPDRELKGNLLIAVPGIPKAKSIPIVFRPEQQVEFIVASSKTSKLIPFVKDGEVKKGEYQLQLTRSSDTYGFVYPILLQKGMWSKWNALQDNEFGKLDFEIVSTHRDPEVRSGVTLGLRRREGNPDRLFYYDVGSDQTRSFVGYTGGEGIDAQPKVSETKDEGHEKPAPIDARLKYFDLTVAREDIQGQKDTDFITTPDKKRIAIRPEIASASNQFYLVILTGKNIEDTTLVVRWKDGGKDLLKLHIGALSEEALRVVEYDKDVDERGFTHYQLENSVSLKKEPPVLAGPQGKLRYRAIVFSGKEAYQEVSSDVYLHISDPSLLNCLYQTSDSDWFAYMDQRTGAVKSLSRPKKDGKGTSHIKLLKEEKDETTKKASEAIQRVISKGQGDQRRSLDLETFFKPDQKIIGQVQQYLFVPGPGIKPGDQEKTVDVVFYYPEKNFAETMPVKVSWPVQKQVSWDVEFDNTGFKAGVYNYPKADAVTLAKKLRLVTTCAAVALLHEKYRIAKDGKEATALAVNERDTRWAQAIRWSLESVNPLLGEQKTDKPKKGRLPANTMGTLGESLNEGMIKRDPNVMRIACALMREILLLSWSPQTQAILSHQLQLKLEQDLRLETSPQGRPYALTIELEPERQFPPLVDEPERYARVALHVPYDQLMLGCKPDLLYQLRQSYYIGIPKNFAQATETTDLLRELYPYPDAVTEQVKISEKTGVHVSNDLYQNLLRDSLWEARLNESNKGESKFWIAMLALSPQIAAITGEAINQDEAGKIAMLIQKQLSSYLLEPVTIQLVDWGDPNKLKAKLEDKEGTQDVNLEGNRDRISNTEEQAGLTRFVERSMMAQFPKNKECWYTSFTFVVDQMLLERCPYHKYVYVRSYRPLPDGSEGPPVKLWLFKRGGDVISPYPAKNYKIDIVKDPSGYTHYVTVKGIPVYQDWFVPHVCDVPGDVADRKLEEKRLRLKLYWDDGETPTQIVRATGYGPPIIDFQAHPMAMILLEVTGYHISPDLIRELMRREFSTTVTKGDPGEEKDWVWKFQIENGPVIMPAAYYIDARQKIVPYHEYRLTWKQTPPDAEGERNLPSLAQKYKMEFAYIDRNVSLPSTHFFPYVTLTKMCHDYDEGMIPERRMAELLEKFFQYPAEIEAVRKKFEWNQDLTDFYKEVRDPKKQMFTYAYSDGHQFMVKIPEMEVFELPKGFDKAKEANHPKVTAPTRKEMVVIWRIVPVSGAQRGFPKYVMEKKTDLFKNTEPIFSKE